MSGGGFSPAGYAMDFLQSTALNSQAGTGGAPLQAPKNPYLGQTGQQSYQDPFAPMRKYQQYRYPQQFNSSYGQPNNSNYGQSFQQQPQMQQGAK